MVFRLEYTGWGLAMDDQVRIIPAASACSDVNGNPRAAWGVTNIKVGCPFPCSQARGRGSSSFHDGIYTWISVVTI